jgi:hypothetical protein
MIERSERPTCGDCLFYEQSRDEFKGICRRFPPCFLGVDSKAMFPVVAIGGWCGEWKDEKEQIYEIQNQDS